MDQTKSQTIFKAFFSVFKQAIVTVGSHIYLVIFPLALDLFLLFGPRVVLSQVLNPTLMALPAIDNFEQQFNLSWEAFITRMMESITQFNAFSSLRTLPFGLPSLISQRLGNLNPFGESSVVNLSNIGNALLFFVLSALIGILLGTIYFTLIAKAVRQASSEISKTTKSFLSTYFNLVAFNLLIWLLALVLLIPIVLLIGLLIRLSAGLGYFVYMVVIVFLLSFLMPLVFTPLFVIAERTNIFQAALKSVRFTRTSGVLASFFIVLSISFSYLTNMLWNSAPNSSPFVLVGVFGHALVTTILLTAGFHFIAWLDRADTSQKPLII
jgi:hypothetical protein